MGSKSNHPLPLSAAVASLPFRQRFILASFGFNQLSWTTVKLYEGQSERETYLMCRRRVSESSMPRRTNTDTNTFPSGSSGTAAGATADQASAAPRRMLMKRSPRIVHDDGHDVGATDTKRKSHGCQLWGLTVCQDSGEIVKTDTWRDSRSNSLQRHYGADRLLRVQIQPASVAAGSEGGNGSGRGTSGMRGQQIVGGMHSNYSSSIQGKGGNGSGGTAATTAASTAACGDADAAVLGGNGNGVVSADLLRSMFSEEAGALHFAGRRYQYLAHKPAQQRGAQGGGYIGWFFSTDTTSSADIASGFVPVSIPEVWEWIGGEDVADVVRPVQ